VEILGTWVFTDSEVAGLLEVDGSIRKGPLVVQDIHPIPWFTAQTLSATLYYLLNSYINISSSLKVPPHWILCPPREPVIFMCIYLFSTVSIMANLVSHSRFGAGLDE